MTNTSLTRPRSKKDAALLSGGVAGAVALGLCCGVAVLAIMFGLTALAAFLLNPWFLIPVVLVTAVTVYWRTTRKCAEFNTGGDERKQTR